MPFGLSNAPSTFQAAMNDIFRDVLRRFVLVFFDVILIYSSSLEEHYQHLRYVFDTLSGHRYYAKKLEWNDHANEAFINIKAAMTTLPVLALPNFSVVFDVTTDAFGTGIGVVLSQHDKPIAFFSKKLCPRMRAASTYIRELYAITEAGRAIEESTWERKDEVQLSGDMPDLEDKVHFEEGDIDTIRVADKQVQTRPNRVKKRPARYAD
nr:reverse transcriptase [Tanacetum cinerariifolium]